MSVEVIETARLQLSLLRHEDDAFILRLLNEESFLRHIGDKGVRTLQDARSYLDVGPLDSYRRHGFGLLRVTLRDSGTAIGICGLLRRDSLPSADLGFALLPEHCGHGHAEEASRAVLADARERLGLDSVLAIVSPDNEASIALLQRLGFAPEGLLRLPSADHEVRLFRCLLQR